MATRFIGTPFSAEFPSSNFAQLTMVNRRPVLAFDPATDETAYWSAIAPQGLTGTLTVLIIFMMATATSGSVYFQAALEAVTPGDTTDLDATTSFDTASSGNATVPGTAGYTGSISITVADVDSIAAGDYFRLRINRDADNGSDNAVNDCYVLAVELRDAA